MKEKVKIWSRRRLLGAFLAFLGLSAVATAQNGKPTANCNTTNVVELVRTIDQMDSTYGTVVTLNFGAALKDYKVYVVAETNGTINSMETPSNCANTLGKRVKLYGATPTNYRDINNTITNPPSYTGAEGNNIVPGAANSWVTIVDEHGKARINVGDNSANPADGEYEFGVFLQEPDAPGCFSDVHVVRITVTQNVYASLVLNGTVGAHEYICSGGETSTNIGFNVCGIPTAATNVTLHYTLKLAYTETAPGATTTTGDAVTGMTFNSVAMSQSGVEFDHEILNYNSVTVEIGQQTLTNTSINVANTVEYTFLEGNDKFYISYESANGTVVLPILFKTADGQCTESGHADALSHTFTVHVAPNFNVQALAYAEGTRPADNAITFVADDAATPNAAVPTFCQGLDAYLHTAYSTTEGFITSYTWSQLTPTDDDQQLTITNNTDRAPVTSDLTQLAYTLNVATLWNDAETNGNYGTGCPANDEITITITEAPKLLVQATNSTFTHEGEVCPGTPINISAQDGSLADGHGITAETILSTGNGIIIDHNNANFSYTIETSGTDLKVFDTWRATQVTEGNLPVVNDFFDNEDNVDPAGNGTITYTIQTIKYGEVGAGTNTCPLVNFDGTALTETTTVDGNTTTTVTNAVKAVYTVSPRPQFILGAN